MKTSLTKAIEIDPTYFIEIDNDKTFEEVRGEVEQLQKQLWNKEYYKVKPLIEFANQEFRELDKYSFEGSLHNNRFRAIQENYKSAKNNFDLKNYFGFLDAQKTLAQLNIK